MDIFTGILIRKANADSIREILQKEKFIFSEDDIRNILKGNQKGVRYGNIVLKRNENGALVERFLKVVIDGSRRTYKLFCRQVNISNSIFEDDMFPAPKMAVIKYSFTAPVPYAIFETRLNGADFGFMHDAPVYYEKFTERDVDRLVETIYNFHASGSTINKITLGQTRRISSCLWRYRREYKKFLRKTILHKERNGSAVIKTVEELLISYTNIPDVRKRIKDIYNINWEYVKASKKERGSYLVHADMQIDNIYKCEDGRFELLDFEWVGRSDNPVIPIMFDYGNLRARAWSTPSFQEKLDKSMLRLGIERYKDERLVNAALKLGLVRSSLMMSRFHMDYKNTVKKDRRTEADYFEMYPKTIAALESAIKTK